MAELDFLEHLACLSATARAQLLEGSEIHSYTAGQTVICRDDPSTSFYVVLSGSVEVTRQNSGGVSQHILSCVPGDAFCILSLIDKKLQPETITAQTFTTILQIKSDAVRALCDAHPPLWEVFQEDCFARIRNLIHTTETLSAHLLPERVAYFLLNLSRRQAKYENGEQILEITEQDAEWMLGASTKRVSRILFQFDELGYLRLHQIELNIQDYERLRRIASDLSIQCSFCSTDGLETIDNQMLGGGDHDPR